MVSSVESDAMSITKWYPPYSALHFPYSFVVYKNQHLGLHSDQMIELASNPPVDLTMVNFWVPGYVGEQVSCVQTRASTSTILQ